MITDEMVSKVRAAYFAALDAGRMDCPSCRGTRRSRSNSCDKCAKCEGVGWVWDEAAKNPMRAALEAALGDMVRDAERYRFVRDGGRFDTYERIRVSQSVSRLENRTSDRLDAAIDAAIAAHSDTGEGREGSE